jgi:hypothetical protein
MNGNDMGTSPQGPSLGNIINKDLDNLYDVTTHISGQSVLQELYMLNQ